MLDVLPRNVHGFPLSPQQRRLWSLQQTSDAYRVLCAIAIEGPVDDFLIERAFHTVTARHDILRTRFYRVPGVDAPVQVVSNKCPLMNIIDLRQLHGDQQEIALSKIVQDDIRHRLHVTHAPPVQAYLLKLSSHRCILVIVLSPLCADSLTLIKLYEEIGTYYGLDPAEAVAPSDAGLQYPQIAEWQNQLLMDELRRADGQALRDECEAAQELGTGLWPSHPGLTFSPEYTTFVIDPSLADRIGSMALTLNVPLSAVLMACWHGLLWNHMPSETPVVADVGTGRSYEDLHKSLGLFAKYLPIRLEFDRRTCFRDAILACSNAIRDSQKRQDRFLWQLGAGLVPRYPRFAYEFTELPDTKTCEQVLFSLWKHYACIDRYALKLNCIRSGSLLSTEFHYDCNTFSAAQIQQLAEKYQKMLVAAVNFPERPTGLCEMLSSAEREQLVDRLNETTTVHEESRLVHNLFEAQVRLTPERIAVECAEQGVTYYELNRRANQLARQLQSIGSGPEVLVGIYLDRSIEILVAIFGILKSGGAYLPLDPSEPESRLEMILKDANVRLVVSDQRKRGFLPDCGLTVLELDTEWQVIHCLPDGDLVHTSIDANLAYAIYTSGSTGAPKGILVPHKGLVNYLAWCISAYKVDSCRGSIVHSSLAVDLTITGLLAPLLTGQRVILLPENSSISELGKAITETSCALIKLTPAHVWLLGQELPVEGAVGHIHMLVIGGEQLTVEQIAYWRKRTADTAIVNEYGPTETVVGCCVYKVAPDRQYAAAIPIGRPIANSQIYLLNDYMLPVGVCIHGNLYVGGDGLARGYLNRPALTAEKMLPNSFNGRPGARLYKTGDIARFLPDGNIEFIGRADRQVKIRGFRVELSEVEAVLRQYPHLQDARVILRHDKVQGKQLVAYIVLPREQHTAAEELRGFLIGRLPRHMVPSVFVQLDTLPLTRNGKVDHSALPIPDERLSKRTREHVAPRTPVEKTLVAIWSKVLGFDSVGVDDNFFDLGGHSMLAAQVIAQLQRALNVKLTLRDLFDAPTIATLAELIAARGRSESTWQGHQRFTRSADREEIEL